MTLPVFIRSYQRPGQLCELLYDLEREGAETVRVFDDCSTANMSKPGTIVCQKEGWSWHRNQRNLGKRLAWQMWNKMFADARLLADVHHVVRFIFLDDDMRLSRRFFELVERHWQAIQSRRKLASMMLLVDSREGKKCWTNTAPVRQGDVTCTQWVDGSFVMSAGALDALGWKLSEIPSKRWISNQELSTGVGEQLSQRLYALGFGMYRVHNSLVAHVGDISHMNPEERNRHPLRARRFIDAGLFQHSDSVQASMATIPKRVGALAKVVKVLLPQVDALRVFLNGHRGTPTCLRGSSKIVVAHSDDHGDKGDAGKFFWAAEGKGYQFTVDDDIWYPGNYVERMVGAINRFQRKAVVGVHGVTFHNQFSSYYRSRKACHFTSMVPEPRAVHLVGTGTLAYHVDTIKVRWDDFRLPNMADVYFGLLCQKQKVPVYAINRRAGWLRGYQAKGGTIYDRHHRADDEQTRLVRSVWPWALRRHKL